MNAVIKSIGKWIRIQQGKQKDAEHCALMTEIESMFAMLKQAVEAREGQRARSITQQMDIVLADYGTSYTEIVNAY